MHEMTDAWLAELTARWIEAEDEKDAKMSAKIDELARNPPTEGEQMYARGEAACLCHCSPPCRLCVVLTQWEASIMSDDLGLLLAIWGEVGDCRELMKASKEIN